MWPVSSRARRCSRGQARAAEKEAARRKEAARCATERMERCAAGENAAEMAMWAAADAAKKQLKEVRRAHAEELRAARERLADQRTAHQEELQRLAEKRRAATRKRDVEHKGRVHAAADAARDEVLTQAAAEGREALREARRDTANAKAGRRAAEAGQRAAEAAEAEAKLAAAAAESEAAEARREAAEASRELASFEADVADLCSSLRGRRLARRLTPPWRQSSGGHALLSRPSTARPSLSSGSCLQRRRPRRRRRTHSGPQQPSSWGMHRRQLGRRAGVSGCRRQSWPSSATSPRISSWRTSTSRHATLGSVSCSLESSCQLTAAASPLARTHVPCATALPAWSSSRTSLAGSAKWRDRNGVVKHICMFITVWCM